MIVCARLILVQIPNQSLTLDCECTEIRYWILELGQYRMELEPYFPFALTSCQDLPTNRSLLGGGADANLWRGLYISLPAS